MVLKGSNYFFSCCSFSSSFIPILITFHHQTTEALPVLALAPELSSLSFNWILQIRRWSSASGLSRARQGLQHLTEPHFSPQFPMSKTLGGNEGIVLAYIHIEHCTSSKGETAMSLRCKPSGCYPGLKQASKKSMTKLPLTWIGFGSAFWWHNFRGKLRLHINDY